MAISDCTSVLATTTATIALNASLSSAIDLCGCELVAIQMPAAWTAANLTFQGSNDGVTYNNVYDDSGNEVAVTAAAARYIVFDSNVKDNFTGIRFIKVRSGTSGAAVVQLAARTITLMARTR